MPSELLCASRTDAPERKAPRLLRFDLADFWIGAPSTRACGEQLLSSIRPGSAFSSECVPSLSDAVAEIRGGVVTLEDAAGAVLALIYPESGGSQHLDRTVKEIGRFLTRARFEGIEDLRDVTPLIIDRFIHEAISNRHGLLEEPSDSTVQVRRGAVRDLFLAARRLGLVSTAFDPTVDVTAAPKAGRPARPLTDEEIDTCRAFACHTMVLTRTASVWALAEATGTPAEIAAVTLADLNLPLSTVRFQGRTGRRPRTGHLTPWGRDRLTEWVDEHHFKPTDRIVFTGATTGISGSALISGALSETLKRAGLTGDRAVKPGSIAAWAALTTYNQPHTTIEDVAFALGVKSLDQAADMVGLDWYAERLAADG